MAAETKIYAPACEVRLLKNVARTTVDGGESVSARFKGARREIDLGPWLSDVSGVRTSKSTREPAGGFSITLSDRIDEDSQDSLAGLIEPMDLVEIRMAHEPHRRAENAGKLPIIMRGFISEVRRAESMGANGRPSRQIIITGQDYGKLWQIYQIAYLYGSPEGARLITQFKLFTQYGVGFETQKAGLFLGQVVEKILNPFIAEMRGQGEAGANPDTSPIVPLTPDVQSGDGIVSPFGVNKWSGGTLYSMLAHFLDVGAFCELFIEDREDGPVIVYRQNPFYSLAGKKIVEYIDADGVERSGFTDPNVIDLPIGDVVSLSTSRTDANVANFFWVDSPRHEIAYGSLLKLAAGNSDEGNYFIRDARNSNPKLYGLRKMQEETQNGAPEEKYHGNGTPKADNATQEIFSGKWIADRRRQLVAQNKDNVVWESGTIRCRGREDLRAGVYVRLLRGTMTYKFYVVQVDHEFIPFVGYFTTLHVERGTGFAERAKRNGGVASPYYSELSRGE